MSWQRDIEEYYIWCERLQTCEIGYPSSCEVGEPRGGGRPKTIVPTSIEIPSHLERIDKAYQFFPKRFKSVMKIKYTSNATNDQARAKEAKMTEGTYKRYMELAVCWMDSWIACSYQMRR